MKYIAFSNSKNILKNINTSELVFDGFRHDLIEVTSDVTITSNNSIILCNGNVIVTLPNAIGLSGCVFKVKNIGSGSITVVPVDSQSIDGASSFIIDNIYASITLVSNGTNWYIL